MYRLPSPVLWTLVFAAVLGHFPALAFDYGRFDFFSLATVAGLDEAPTWSVRGWTEVVTWSLWWRVGGADPMIPHGATLLLVAGNALLLALVAARIGMTRSGAVFTAALWLLGPWTGLAVAATTAAAELWALGFALAALLLWLSPNVRRDSPLAGILGVAALASGGIGIALPAILAWAGRQFVLEDEDTAIRRGRVFILVVLLALSGATCIALLGDEAAPLFRGTGLEGAWPGPALHQLGAAAWIWPGWPPEGLLRFLGVAVALAIAGTLFFLRGQPAPRCRLAALWVVAALVPASLLPGLETQSGALPVAAGLALFAGALTGRGLEELLSRLQARVNIGGALALVALLLVVGPGWATLRAAGMGETDSNGHLVHPALRQAAIVAGVRQQITSVMGSPAPPPQFAFLQAARTRVHPTEGVPEGSEVIFDTAVHNALAGEKGPLLMVAGRARVRWTTLLDLASPDAFVFLDVGDERVRPLGPTENARIYAGLIAVAAGQMDLARHEFWTVIGAQGAEVRFAFDPDHLPIEPDELDAGAAPFARWLREDDSPSSLRILKFFGQLYESIRGQPLLEEGFGGPLRSGRMER
jgi:hypothetical protein